MDWAVVVVLQVMLQPSLSALFTVEAEQTTYKSKFGEDVVMGCRFQPKLPGPLADLEVNWHWIGANSFRDVYKMDNWKENLALQHPDYQGRVRLLTDQLLDGWAKLEISRLRINDSGNYQCLVRTKEGTDYKAITLSVTAPYKDVTKRIQKAAEGDELLLTCQSEGYPQSSVMWHNGHQRTINSSTTAESTPEQLFKVTSQIRVGSSEKNNYTCTFTNDGSFQTFVIPDDIPAASPQVKSDALFIILSIGVIMAVIVFAVLMYRRRKGFRTHSTRNLLVDSRGCMEENLGVFLKRQYANIFSSDARHHQNVSNAEDLLHTLQNNELQPLNLQALIPETGETLFLEGPPGSGKTTVAHILVSSWTEGPTNALSNLLDLSTIQLLFYVDCRKLRGNLFQEIRTQLSLTEKISTEDELRTLLTRTCEVLLLLDGYREGNHYFDESLRKFLMEKGGCRVLVMACTGHCPMLKGTVGSKEVVQLQTNSVKY
ncbi:uncharacterized protein si:ch211-241b2.5 [Plectropomus leopardus]|uniref:uncharacterized protein si:ch211-241b2.5 n=1 Tax=Plectropomus leopardus TaxID=160734 RepID=UPI001C4BB7B4|nr:uncharacterized protein si:ch211-241b2.5 [Plectropomus leopardus]